MPSTRTLGRVLYSFLWWGGGSKRDLCITLLLVAYDTIDNVPEKTAFGRFFIERRENKKNIWLFWLYFIIYSINNNWRDILADRIRMLSCLQFPCLVSSALFTFHLSSLCCSDSNRLPSDLEASSHRTTSVRVGTWLFNQCHYEKLRPPVPLVLRRSTIRIKQ
jgi:hypothetical protein